MAKIRHNAAFVFISAVFFLPCVTHAQVVTEIMYDTSGSDSGHEWIEVWNTGASSLALTAWRLFEADTNHKIVSVRGGDSLPGSAYAVIADNADKFLADHPNFSGVLFDSTFSLSNSGETIILRDEKSKDVAIATYTSGLGASGDGNSLQRTKAGETFSVRSASPGSSLGGPAALVKKSAPATKQKQTVKKTSQKTLSAETVDAPPFAETVVGEVEDTTIQSDAASPEAQVAAAASAPGQTLPWWLLGLLGFVGLSGALAIGVNRSKRASWNIIEGSSDTV